MFRRWSCCFSLPQGDTNTIAHNLIERFGSFSQVLEADAEELKKVRGIKDHAATLLAMMIPLLRFYQTDSAGRVKVLPNLEACADYLVPRFFGRDKETVFLLCLDAKCKFLDCRCVGEGSFNSAGISLRKIVETAISTNAAIVMLAHNHPAGVALPSDADVLTTRRIAAALKAVEVHLADHIVVAEGDYVSMVQSGYRFDDFTLL